MITDFFVKRIIIDRKVLFYFFLLPFLFSCSSGQNTVNEIITPPPAPNDVPYIPDRTESSQLISLLSVDEKIKQIKIGRRDPFLPPALDGAEISVPSSFKYYGQISSADLVNAFVSYKDRKGTIKPGDIGGQNTDLLPDGWTFSNLNRETKVLTLVFESQSIDIDLFPE